MAMETIIGGGGDWRAPLGLGRLLSRWGVCTFVTPGDASGSQALLAILNGTTDRRLCVPVLRFWSDMTAAITAIEGYIRVGRDTASLIGAGTAIAKGLLDTRMSSSALATALMAASANGGPATPITGTTAPSPTTGTMLAQAELSVMHTLAGQRLALWQDVAMVASPPVLNPGQALTASYVGTGAGNPVTAFYAFSAIVEEYGA